LGTLPATGIVHHTALLPLSEGSVAIDQVLGAVNYRSLRTIDARATQIIFRRLPLPRFVSNRER
jgi:hypothetical protein